MRANSMNLRLRAFRDAIVPEARWIFYFCACLAALPGQNASAQTAPAILTQPLSQVVVAGSNLTVSVTVTGAPMPVLQWRFNGTNLSGANASALTLTNMTVAQSGNYDVVVTNALGSVTSGAATLTVVAPPAVSLNSAVPGAIRLNGSSLTGLTYVVQMSTNLNPAFWTALTTNQTAIDGAISFPINSNAPAGFYRLMFP